MELARFLRTRVLPHFGGDQRYARLAFIEEFDFPGAVTARFARDHAEFDEEERAAVFEALRDYFAIRAADPDRQAGVPSRIVDAAWRTFNDSRAEYILFCERAFGRELPYRRTPPDADADLGQTWRIACAIEEIPHAQPGRLPRLFAIDRHLNVLGGRYYALNETDAASARRAADADATVRLVALFSKIESWRDPIFSELHHNSPTARSGRRSRTMGDTLTAPPGGGDFGSA